MGLKGCIVPKYKDGQEVKVGDFVSFPASYHDGQNGVDSAREGVLVHFVPGPNQFSDGIVAFSEVVEYGSIKILAHTTRNVTLSECDCVNVRK